MKRIKLGKKHLRRRSLAMVLAILMVFTGVDFSGVIKVSATENGSAWEYPSTAPSLTWTGTGEQSDPYMITTPQELADLAYMVNQGTTYRGKFFQLGNDINLGNQEWTGIGDYNGTMFKGTLDGAGNTISGLSITNSKSSQGLFGGSSGTIENVIVAGSINCKGGYYIAGICGYNESIIQNCVNRVSVTVESNNGNNGGKIGGICGYNNSYGSVISCYNEGIVSTVSTDSIGSVCGFNYVATIKNCYYKLGTNTKGIGQNGYSGDEDTSKYQANEATQEDITSGALAWKLNTKNGTIASTSKWAQGETGPTLANDSNKAIYRVRFIAADGKSIASILYLTEGSVITVPENYVVIGDSVPEKMPAKDLTFTAHTHNFDENYYCSGCDTQMVASVTVDKVTTIYETMTEAIIEAQKNTGSTLKLLTDYVGALNITGSFTLDLAGHSITGDGTNVQNCENVAIAVLSDNVHLNIIDSATGGSVNGASSGSRAYALFVSASSSSVNIQEGDFTGSVAVVCYGGKVTLEGGTYHMSENDSDGVFYAYYGDIVLGDGYYFFDTEGNSFPVTSINDIEQAVTVGKTKVNIINQPEDKKVVSGYTQEEAPKLSVDAEFINGGTGKMSYQWCTVETADGPLGDETITPIDGAIQKEYQIPTGLSKGYYSYICYVKGSGCTVVSDRALVTVNGPIQLDYTFIGDDNRSGDYATLSEAIGELDRLKAQGSTMTNITIKLSTDSVETEDITIGHKVTLDLNGKKLDMGNNSLIVSENGDLTVKGKGDICSDITATDKGMIDCQTGSFLTIENGTFTSKGHVIKMNGGTAILNGGTYTGAYDAVHVTNASNLTLNGGTFVKGDSTCVFHMDGTKIADCLGVGKTFYEGDIVTGMGDVLAQPISEGTDFANTVIVEKEPVTSVTTGTKVGYYDSLSGAVLAAKDTQALVTLLQDTTEKTAFRISGLTLNLGENTLTADVTAGDDVIIKNGNLVPYSTAMVASGENLLLSNVTLQRSEGRDALVITTGGNVTIDNSTIGTIQVKNGGILTTNSGSYKTIIVQYTNSRAIIKGGHIGAYYAFEDTFTELKGGTFDDIFAVGTNRNRVSQLLADGYGCRSTQGEKEWVDTNVGRLSNVTVEPAPVTVSVSPEVMDDVEYGYNSIHLISVQAQRAEDVTAEVRYQWYQGSVASGNEIANEDGDSITIPVGLSIGNHTYICVVMCDGYKVETKAVTFTVSKANPTVVTPTVTGYTYNPDMTLRAITLNGTNGSHIVGEENVTVTGNWSWKLPDTVPTVNNSEYIAVFTPDDLEHYNEVEKTVTIAVEKATPVVNVMPVPSAITYGQLLSDSTLSNGTAKYSNADGAANVAGTYEWNDASTKPSVADSDVIEYDVKFAPSDNVNYNSFIIQLKLIVNKDTNAPNMPETTMNPAHSVGTVGDVTLPNGWSWKDEDKTKTLSDGVAVTATAIYSGVDKGNYEKESVEIVITRLACSHNWGQWKVTTEATYEQEGVETRVCANCGITETRTIPKLLNIVSNNTDSNIVTKGKTYTIGSMKYKVTNASTNGKGTVTLTGTTKKKTDSKFTTLSVGNTITIEGVSFKITAIGNKAFQGFAKIKKVVLGKELTKIGSSAFYNCKKLSSFTIKSSKLKSVGKNAIKSIRKSATIDVPNKKVSDYKKLFKGSIGYKKTMKIK